MRLRTVCVWVVWVLLINSALSQGRPGSIGGRGGFPGSSSGIPQDTSNVEKDSLIHDVFMISDIDLVEPFSDTMVDYEYHQYTPLGQDGLPMLDLGNPGSPSRTVTYIPKPLTSFDLGFRAFDPYKLDRTNTQFKIVNRPVANVSFGQYVGGGSNFIAKADYAQRYKDGIVFNLNFTRHNHEGFYVGQRVTNSALALGVLYQPDSSRYSAVINFTLNAHQFFENGGVSDKTEFAGQFATFRNRISTELTNAGGRQAESRYSIYSYYQLSEKYKGFKAIHEFDYVDGYFKYFDDELSSQDSMYYEPLVNDFRGIRHVINTDQISNYFSIKGQTSSGISGRLGIKYLYTNVHNGINRKGINDFNVLFEGRLPIGQSLELNTDLDFGIGANIGLFNAVASTKFKLSDLIALDVSGRFYRSRPGLIAEQLVLNSQLLYERSFDKELGTVLSGKLSIPGINTELGITQSVIGNAIYANLDGLLVQSSDPYTHTTISLRNTLKVGRFGLESRGVFQLVNQDLYQMPQYFSVHDLYYQGAVFKGNMNLRLGVEGRVFPSYEVPDYNPVLGVFYQSDEVVSYYPLASAYAAGKVSRFRFKLKVENTTQYFNSQIYYPTADYPYVDATIRLSLSWLLLD